jgi:two-component system, sensor histidine kinase and response regulator
MLLVNVGILKKSQSSLPLDAFKQYKWQDRALFGNWTMMDYSILVVDDEPDNFDTIEALLHNTNYELYYVSSAREALDSLDTFSPDVILLDVMMPDMDGLTACTRIKSMRDWQGIPIIMITALASREDLSRCLAAGADDFISKPINKMELQARLQSMLRIKKQHDRIQSLSTLQQHNINSLSDSCEDLKNNLSVLLTKNLAPALEKTHSEIERLQDDIYQITRPEVVARMMSLKQTIDRLERLNDKFLFYLKLNTKNTNKQLHLNCSAKEVVERYFNNFICNYPTNRVILDLVDSNIPIAADAFAYIVGEFLEYAFDDRRGTELIYIHCRPIDGSFHFWLDRKAIDSYNNEYQRVEQLLEMTTYLSHDDLEIGCKLSQKLAEISEGLFFVKDTDLTERIYYMMLPIKTPTLAKIGA